MRHGYAEGVERRQVLLGIVALAGWLQVFASAPALELLADYLSATFAPIGVIGCFWVR